MRVIYLGPALVLLSGVSAVAYEQPDYRVLAQYEEFELRQYQPYLVAETVVDGDFENVGYAAFRVLADYISGNNRSTDAIGAGGSLQRPDTRGERIAMTAPVTQKPADPAALDSYVFSFVMPSRFTLETLPRPLDPRVTLRQVPSRKVAALRYSGTWSEERYRVREQELLDAIASEGLEPLGATGFARYNGPFTPWFLRRNEILVEVR